jgi:hypothetical protein
MLPGKPGSNPKEAEIWYREMPLSALGLRLGGTSEAWMTAAGSIVFFF